MSTPANHWKLGLFVVLGVVLGVVTFIVLGARNLHKETVSYKSYFDESVQGLDVGSPVKFRGVTVGNVSGIDVAPDRRRVEITSDLDINELNRLGLAEKIRRKVKIYVPPDLRIQLASQGITGVKFLLIDYFPVKSYPPPDLPFPVPENYIPSATSTMKNLEDSVVQATEQLPHVIDGVLAILTKVNNLLENLESKHLGEHAATTLTTTNQMLESLLANIKQLHTEELSQRTQQVLESLNTTATRTNALLDRVGGDNGLLASTQRTSNALSDVAHNANGLTTDLDEMVRTIHDAAEGIRRVSDALERDPDMLLKGRAKRTR